MLENVVVLPFRKELLQDFDNGALKLFIQKFGMLGLEFREMVFQTKFIARIIHHEEIGDSREAFLEFDVVHAEMFFIFKLILVGLNRQIPKRTSLLYGECLTEQI